MCTPFAFLLVLKTEVLRLFLKVHGCRPDRYTHAHIHTLNFVYEEEAVGLKGGFFFLLLLHSFDWLAAFHLELLQAILFIVV